MEVHFNPESTANNISIKDVSSISEVYIIMDSRKERMIIVEYHNHIIKFHEFRDGLYNYDTVNNFSSRNNSYYYLIIVKNNKKYFSTSEIQGADEARKLQQENIWTSTSHFRDIVSKQLLRNCTVTVDDYRRAKLIYGSPTPILQI